MKLTNVHEPTNGPVAQIYEVEAISPDDIAGPSEHFLNTVRTLSDSASLNGFTKDEFVRQVRRSFGPSSA